MQKIVALIGIVVVLGVGVWYFFPPAQSPGDILVPPTQPGGNGAEGEQICNQDAMICPDGSSVGRVGPNCEFALCPSTGANSSLLLASLGEKTTGLGLSLTPLEVVQDSRCPQGVQCIWAGTVQLRVRLDSGMGTAFETMELGKPITTETQEVTLVEVTPAPNPDKEIPSASYRFVFEVKKR